MEITQTQFKNWMLNNGYWDAFVENFKKTFREDELETMYKGAKTPAGVLLSSFDWKNTKQGVKYWDKVYKKLLTWEKRFQDQSQCQQILEYLQDGSTLTAIDALNLFGCFRLQARICDLRTRGWGIKTESIKTSSGKRIARYSLNEEEK